MTALDHGRRSGGSAASRRRELTRARVRATQRLRIMSAMAAAVSDRDVHGPTITDVVRLAGVSRKTFYEIFEDGADCLRSAIDHALALSTERASAGYHSSEDWVDAVRAGLTSLLQFFDDEPQMAWLCVVQSAAAGIAEFDRRGEVLDELARIVDEGRILARLQPPPLTAEGVVGGALSVVSRRLVNPEAGPLIDLVNPLMSVIVLPYRGNAVARDELSRRVSAAPVPPATRAHHDALEGLPMRLTNRTIAVLAVISEEPGLSNSQVSERAGVTDQGQISKLLARLSHLGLAENVGAGQPRGTANAWHLTLRGKELQDAIGLALRALSGNGSAANSMTA